MTPKQQLFCDNYLISLNATQAAMDAGYSKKTAMKIGSENLQKLEIKKYIDERMNKMSKSSIASLDEVLSKITEIIRDEHSSRKDILKACDLILRRYPTEMQEQDNRIEVIIKRPDED